ncbi:glycosyl transferase family 90 [Guyparkeria sp. TX1]|uniref:glycosyl transferase family 90 n=1 Tax=Guyparkeria sp. TX1 TaxID=3115001 RepID=UPI0039776996
MSTTERAIDIVRDLAIYHEDISIDVSHALMRLAANYRPHGPLIKQKIFEYEAKHQKPFYLSNEKRLDLCIGQSAVGKLHHEGKQLKARQGYVKGEVNAFSVETSDQAVAVGSYVEDMKAFLAACGEMADSVLVKFGDEALDKAEMLLGPVFVKSRPIGGQGIVLKLNTARHWDNLDPSDFHLWGEKDDNVVWRGQPTGTHENRSLPWDDNVRLNFVKNYSANYDVGFSKLGPQGDKICEPFVKGVLGKKEQLKSKYVVSLEGNDVATNLKWILASNSVPIMPHPTFESWLLESQLIPYVHYVPLSDGLDDLDEVYAWCLSNDEHCRRIAENGKRYMEMFFDEANEKEMCRMIYKKYKSMVEG